MSDKVKLIVEVADSPSKWQRGLMYRTSLDKEAGMLFKFNKNDVLNFWGLNTYIPLDIAFVSDDLQIIKISEISPRSFKTVSSDKKCKIAIEANKGFFSDNGIFVGDSIDITDDMTILFVKNKGKE